MSKKENNSQPVKVTAIYRNKNLDPGKKFARGPSPMVQKVPKKCWSPHPKL